ncbi:DUF1700 domain-containing protein [Lachnospiraceae bacterium MD335]|jgi:uncharacterized membrane protein|nr:hypothetical protein C809_00981 [Lachnospiraceae bacterium MD335]NDO51237.1 DUF1700 domain-containing protein [Lachnospiraceae bacterium MD335]
MNKNEYLERLSKLLADISYEEHEEALSYYREYIEDAGAENEQRVIEELGTPEHLAQEIREGLLKKGEPSRRQGEPIRAPKLRTDSGNRSSQASDKTPERSKSNVILIIIAVILTSPLWFPLACAVIGTVFGIIVTAFAIVLSVGIIGIVCTAVGIALIIAGFLACLSVTVYSVSGTLAGAALIGSGLITLALGILFTVLTVWLCGWALPALIHFIRQTISRISCRRKEAHV